jgi:hypothetical protein
MSETAPEAGTEAEELLAEAAAEEQLESQEPAEQTVKPDTGKPPVDLQAEIAKWKSLARKHESTAKQNADAARKFAEWEDSQKSEQQRLADQLAAAEQRAVQAEIGRAKLMAAATYDIPVSMLDRIGGATEDEINEAAEAIAAEINAAVEAEVAKRLAAAPAVQPEPVQPARTRPVESLSPGALPPGNGEPIDGNAFLRRMAGRTV